MRGTRGLITAAMAAAILLTGAGTAQAGLSTWDNLPGLNAAAGAGWVRVYAADTVPTTLYAGTEGDGVFKSTNSGLTWSAFSGGLPAGSNVRALLTGGGKVYAGSDTGLWVSSGGAWSPLAQGAQPDPAHPTKLNASIQALLSQGGTLLAGTAFQGVARSTDNGATFAPAAAGNGMPAGETVWGLTAYSSPSPVVFAATSSGVYRSTDTGATWSLASDGIPGSAVVLRVIQDGVNPQILYAATGSDGLYRSINFGLTWSPVNDGPAADHSQDLGNLTVRGLQQFTSGAVTRLYTATGNGVYTGTTDNGPLPGPVSWRKVTTSGLGGNTITWAITSFLTPPGTLLIGTQSGGGYALTFQPPVKITNPSAPVGTTQVGRTLTAPNVGTWSGTDTITYDRQWQRCTAANSGCSDIAGETGAAHTLVDADQGRYLRIEITAHNDFPTGPLSPTATSTTVGPIGAAPSSIPGYNQLQAPSISVNAPGDPSLPVVGDTLHTTNGLFNPVATGYAYVWLRCDENGGNCTPIPGPPRPTTRRPPPTPG